MTEETTHPKDGDHIKYKTIRLPVKTRMIVLDFQVKDEEAAKEAWRLLVKASGFSIVTDPVLRVDHDIWHDETVTVIEGAVVEHPDVPGLLPLRNQNYIEFYILEGSND